MVFALTPPEIHEDSLQGIKLNERLSINDLSVEMSIQFAHGIRSSSLRAEKYDLETVNSITGDSYRDKFPTHGTAEDQIVFADRNGDVVNSRWQGSLSADEELDLHIQGSHLPFLASISRPAFWTGIWLVILSLFIVSTVLPTPLNIT